jgi:L-cysteine desulfidase
MNDKEYVELLERELVPAMGCTEPIAVAYAAAIARRELGTLPERVDVTVSSNIIKNVKSVIVPNTDGLHGIEAAAAAGIIAGKSEKVLLGFPEVTEDEKKAIAE